MKKLFVLFAAAIMLCGCQNLCTASKKDGYKVMVLGDLHYDGLEYHKTPATTPNRAKERIRNCEMWKEATPKLLSCAASQLDKDIPFIIQAGDFVQGDCDTIELQEKMIKDGFAAIKKYFPNHKLFPVRGNHDVRMLKGNSGTPTVNAYFPLIAKELGVKKITGSYSVRHEKDLYIFFDAFLRKGQSLKALKNILAANTDVRHTFFITHLPVLNCCMGNPAWLVQDFKEIRQLLLDRNAIIIAAHTHVPSIIQAKRNGKLLTQVVVSSIGKDWVPGSKPTILLPNFDAYCKKIGDKRINQKRFKPSFDDMKTFELPVFNVYTFKSVTGFAMLKVSGNEVFIEYYTDNSGKPALTQKLR